jgi:heme exporter protein D
MPSTDFLLSMGPYGALVWGAYLLGKGVKVTVQIELSERDRDLAERLGKASSVL